MNISLVHFNLEENFVLLNLVVKIYKNAFS